MKNEFPIELLRPEARLNEPFRISETPYEAKLDQNESPEDAVSHYKQKILEEVSSTPWNRYPQPSQYMQIKSQFANALGQPPERIAITAGGDQAIMLAFLAGGGHGRRARIFEPTYPMIAAFARATQTQVDRVVLGPDFDLPAELVEDPVDLLILVSPNNPTGNSLDRNLIIKALNPHQLVFLDEAYTDYSGHDMIDLIDEHPNLMIGRSLSKSLLAGVRLGYVVGHAYLIQILEQLIFAPYHLNMLQLSAAKHFSLLLESKSSALQHIITQRNYVYQQLCRQNVKVWNSNANFILFEPPDAKHTYQQLIDRGIRVRDVSALPGLSNHLRVTIGTRDENRLFLEVMSDITKKHLDTTTL